MRLFVASGIFHPEPGGPATYLYRLLPELQSRGFDITALTFGDQDVAAYPYPLTRIPRRFYPLRQWEYFRAASRLWADHDLAYIHSLGLPLPAALRPRLAKIVGDQAWERALVKGWIAPDTDIDTFQSTRFGPQIELNKTLRARDARRMDHIIVPSQHRRHMVIGWGVDPERVTVIYNALETPSLSDTPSREQLRRELNIRDAPLLLTVARLSPLKGIHHILSILAERPDIHFVIAGDGPQRAELEALTVRLSLTDRVRFLGHIPREQVARWYRAADYTILYSGGEGLSHVLLESLAADTPVIASDKGGNPEVVEDGVNGLLVPYVDVNALRAAINAAFQSGMREKLASNSQHGMQRFKFDTMIEQTIAVLNRFA